MNEPETNGDKMFTRSPMPIWVADSGTWEYYDLKRKQKIPQMSNAIPCMFYFISEQPSLRGIF